VDYRPQHLEHHEPWSLVVYVDGAPVMATAGSPHPVVPSGPRVRTLALAPGPHAVRLLQERHVPQGGGRWRHEARACATSLDLEPSAVAQVLEITVAEAALPAWHRAGSVSWRHTRGDTEVGGEAHVGGVTSEWPPLCEEVATRIPESMVGTAGARRAMAGCVEWRRLWPGAPSAPDRAEARGQLLSGVW
jgi:hypothetical protein